MRDCDPGDVDGYPRSSATAVTVADHVRGVLRDASKPLTEGQIVRRACISAKLVQRALKHLVTGGHARYEERPWLESRKSLGRPLMQRYYVHQA